METRTMYHTQEHRNVELLQPLRCSRDDAWLGEGVYFWYEEQDAHYWGRVSKKGTGKYEIYSGEVNTDDVLDTVFNQEHYFFWLEQIEKAALAFIEKGLGKPTLKELNDYFKERAIWDEVDGIFFQDLPDNADNLLVKPIRIRKRVFKKQGVEFPVDTPILFNYKKRIQIVIFNLSILSNFKRIAVGNCTSN